MNNHNTLWTKIFLEKNIKRRWKWERFRIFGSNFDWKITIKCDLRKKIQNKILIFPMFGVKSTFSELVGIGTMLGVWKNQSTHRNFKLQKIIIVFINNRISFSYGGTSVISIKTNIGAIMSSFKTKDNYSGGFRFDQFLSDQVLGKAT